MEVQKYHYSSYLISVHFERGFMPDSLSGKIEICEDFLNDLGDLARKHGKRLYATYSICLGINGYHAHFAVSWLPLLTGYLKTAQSGNKHISRKPIIDLLVEHYFYVDNPMEAIKQIIKRKKYVTDYVIYQPKENQVAEFSEFYIHPILEPIHSEAVSYSYCLMSFFDGFGKALKRPHVTIPLLFVLISILILHLISFILLSLF